MGEDSPLVFVVEVAGGLIKVSGDTMEEFFEGDGEAITKLLLDGLGKHFNTAVLEGEDETLILRRTEGEGIKATYAAVLGTEGTTYSEKKIGEVTLNVTRKYETTASVTANIEPPTANLKKFLEDGRKKVREALKRIK